MARPATVSREEVLDRLQKAFRACGYDATSLADLAEATGLKKASLYHYFPGGKREMVLAVVDKVMQEFAAAVARENEMPGSAEKRLDLFFQVLLDYFGTGEELCVIGNLAVSSELPGVAGAVASGFSAWTNVLVRCLREMGVPKEEARMRALEAVALFQGSIVLTRGLNDPRIFRQLIKRMRVRLLSDVS